MLRFASSGLDLPSRPAHVRSRRTAMKRLATIMSAAIVAGGCNSLPPPDLRTPRLEVADVSIRDVGLSELRFAVIVRADNPNDVDIPLTNLTFDLDVLDRPFASGIAVQPRVVLPRLARSDVPIEFTVPTMRLLDTVGQLATGRLSNLSYRFKGSANWGNSFIPIPFEKSGNLDVLRRLREALGPLMRLP